MTIRVLSTPEPTAYREWALGKPGYRDMVVNPATLPRPKNPHDRYEIERLLEREMDEHFGEHLSVHIWTIHPILEIAFGTNVEHDPDWWKSRYGA